MSTLCWKISKVVYGGVVRWSGQGRRLGELELRLE